MPGKVVFEGELGIVIGTRCRDVAEARRRPRYSATPASTTSPPREMLSENADFAQWCRAKGFDTFGCLGPVIATGLDWRGLRVMTRLNGDERQNYPLSRHDLSAGAAGQPRSRAT